MLLRLQKEQIEMLQRKNYYGGSFMFADAGFRIFSDNKRYIDNFKKIYEAFVVQDLDETTFTCYILNSCNLCTGPCVIIDSILYELPGGDRFIGSAEVLLLQKVLDRIKSCFLIHAGVVEKNGNGYIIYAPSGFGKTTLVLQLVSKGYKFLSDEYCPIRYQKLMIEPFARRISIKQGSPFINAVVQRASDALWYEDTYHVHCDDLFPGASGAACRAKYFIMLTNNQSLCGNDDSAQRVVIELFDDTQGIIERLCQTEGIRVLKRHQLGYCTKYLLEVPHNRKAIYALHSTMKYYEQCIYAVASLREHKTDFSNKPQLSAMHKSEAMFEILSNLLNRSPSSAFLAAHGGKHQHLLMKLGAFLKDVECYRLTTGNLDDMARLIDAL